MRPYTDKSVVGGNGTPVVTVQHDMYEITIGVDELAITGLYEKQWNRSFDPATFIVGDPVQVRLDAKNLYIQRPDGKELKAKIIRRAKLADQSHQKS